MEEDSPLPFSNTQFLHRTSPRNVSTRISQSRQHSKNLAFEERERARLKKIDENRAKLHGTTSFGWVKKRIDEIPCPTCPQGKLTRVYPRVLGCGDCQSQMISSLSTEDILQSIRKSGTQHENSGCRSSTLSFGYEEIVGYFVYCDECPHLDVIF
ncbi:hypothetical protein HMI54_008835 [Coelomomyces lativittatus]|nr:hypothetical protein HMI56_000843 [Coelomomyces lativittatus]KAJ1516602.1 hypothetical protein HMI54_008835 [Coelomomyces lativittatus]